MDGFRLYSHPVLLAALLCSASFSWAATSENLTAVDSYYYANTPAPAPGSCPYGTKNATLNAEVTQGPYYLNELLFRTNITENQLGLPFEARITVLDTNCNPVVGAYVDVWHCNATGVYSGYTSSSPGGNLAPAAARKLLQDTSSATDNSTFLRGTVQTDSNGVAVVQTIVPGWYTGRVTHMHTMIHLSDATTDESEDEEYEDSRSVHTGQFFFEEALLDAVYQLYPYSRHTGDRVELADDSIYASGGDDTTQIFTTGYASPGKLAAGLIGSVTAVIDTSANNTVGFSMPGGMGGGAPGMGGPDGQMPGGITALGPMPARGPGFGGALPQVTGRRLLR